MLALLQCFFAAGCCATAGLVIILANKVRRTNIIARRSIQGICHKAARR